MVTLIRTVRVARPPSQIEGLSEITHTGDVAARRQGGDHSGADSGP